MRRFSPLALFGVALFLGVFADMAIRDSSMGLAMFLWVVALVTGFAALQTITGQELVYGWRWMASAALGLSLTFLLRRSEVLGAFVFLAIGGTTILMALRGARPRLDECGLLEYVHGAVVSGVHAAIGFPMLLFSDIRKDAAPGRNASRRAAGIMRGATLAAPVVLILGALFVGADAVFEQLVLSVFDIDLASIIQHFFFISFVTWVVGGYLRGTFIARAPGFPYAQTKPLSLGITEVSVVLGSSIVLFSLFIAVQFRYLFGGADLVQVTPALTYAEYARRGFFELTAVVALVLPLLLALDWLLKRETPAHARTFRILAFIQVVLLFAVIGSAAQRMLLYQQEYGLTILRVNTMALMGWMGALLIWYVVTVLSGRRSRFAFGAVASAIVTLLVLVAINPEDLITRTNIAQAGEGKEVDIRYLVGLSDDAVPALLDGFHRMDATSREAVAKNLLQRRARLAAEDWRSWNLSAATAQRALEEHAAQLQTEAR